MVIRQSVRPEALSALVLVMVFFLTACGSNSATRAQVEPAPANDQQTVVQDDNPERDMKDYVGSYEGREITLAGSILSYFREGMPMPVALTEIGEDHFEINIPPGAQIRGHVDGQIPTFRFNRDSSGNVESMSLVNPDGTVVSTFEKG